MDALVEPDGARARNAVDGELRPLVQLRSRDVRGPGRPAVLDDVVRLLLAASGEPTGFQAVHDDLVLGAREVVRGALADYSVGEGTPDEEPRRGSNRCAFHPSHRPQRGACLRDLTVAGHCGRSAPTELPLALPSARSAGRSSNAAFLISELRVAWLSWTT